MSAFIPIFLTASLLASVGAAPVLPSTPPPVSTSASGPATTPTAMVPTSASTAHTTASAGYILLDWDTSSPSPTSMSDSGTTSSILLHPAATTPAPTAAAAPGPAAAPSKTKASWALPPQFSNMDPFGITSYAAGEHNIAVLRGAPVKWENGTAAAEAAAGDDTSVPPPEPSSGHIEKWDMGVNSLQITYPNGSINPGNKPQGGAEFYAEPLDLRAVTNTTLQYSVYFPHDFEFVKGGKLPGLYGGHKGCSGGNAAEDCFSTRIMWRAGGKGELYLYVPKDKQTPQLCSTPPQSVCDSDYGLSIGRGAWTFPAGDWTTIRQDIWLNTPGVNDGGFNIWINGDLVMTANDVRYRENAVSCTDSMSAAAVPVNNEDWSSLDAEAEAEDVSSTATATDSTTSSASAAPTSSDIASPSSIDSEEPQPTFQTPMRRWVERDEAEVDSGSDDDEEDPESTLPSAKPFVPTALISSSARAPTSTSTAQAVPMPTATPALGDSVDAGPAGSVDQNEDESAVSDSTSPDSTDASAASDKTTVPAASADPTASDAAAATGDAAACGVGFIGLFFSTFFGGHTADWATPKDQFTYYKDFEMWVN